MEDRGQIRDPFLCESALLVYAAPDACDHEQNNREHDKRDQRELPAQHETDRQVNKEKERLADHRLKRCRDAGVDDGDVVHDPRDQVPRPFICEVCQRKLMDVPVERVPQVAREPLFNVDHQVRLEVREEVPEEKRRDDDHADVEERIRGVRAEDGVAERLRGGVLRRDQPSREERRPCRGRCRRLPGRSTPEECRQQGNYEVDRHAAEDREENRTENRESKREPVRADEAEYAGVRCHCFRLRAFSSWFVIGGRIPFPSFSRIRYSHSFAYMSIA